MRHLWSRWPRIVALVSALGLTALVVPDSTAAPAQTVLVQVQRAEGVDTTPDVIWIMAIGSDARPGQDMTTQRGDALQLVGMDTRTGAATAIGIARDSYVQIPGHGSDKINAALTYGGPEAMAGAVADLVGITPDYVMVTRFEGLERMVEAINGITVDNPRFFSDRVIKAEGYPAGRLQLRGYGALAFSRIRHGLPGGDFDRSANQQRVLRGIQAKVAKRAGEPGFIENGVAMVMKEMATVGVSPAELFRLGQAVAQVRPGRITGCVVTGGFGRSPAGASIVLPDRAQAQRYGDDARDDAVISDC